MKQYGTITGTIKMIWYFIGTTIGILSRFLNYAKYTLSVVPDINLKHIGCLSVISITSCENRKVVHTAVELVKLSRSTFLLEDML